MKLRDLFVLIYSNLNRTRGRMVMTAMGVVIGTVIAKLIDLVAGSFLTTSGTTASSVVAIPLWLPFFAIGFSIVIGLAAGIYPAFRAVQLDPVEALRYE